MILRIYGKPAPQGSKSFYGKGRVVESSPDVAVWRQQISDAIGYQQRGQQPALFDGPVHIDALFIMPRPRSHWRTGKHAGQLKATFEYAVPAVYPDIDKILRATLDGLTATKKTLPNGKQHWLRDGLLKDDGQVTQLGHVEKIYESPGNPPGAEIEIFPAKTPRSSLTTG